MTVCESFQNHTAISSLQAYNLGEGRGGLGGNPALFLIYRHHPILVFDFSNEYSKLNLAPLGGVTTLWLPSYDQLK